MFLTWAFDGAISGLVAVLLMTLFEAPFWLRLRMPGVVEWQVNEILTSKLLRQPYDEGKRLGWAITMHQLHGIALGTVFSIMVSVSLPINLAILLLAGSAYSLALWCVVPFMFRPALQHAGRTTFTKKGLTISLFAHIVYGLSLGGFLTILLR